MAAAAATHRKKPLTWIEEDCLEHEQRVASFTAASYIKMKASDEVKTQVPMVLHTLFGNSKPGFATEEGDATLLSTPSRGCVDPFGNFVFADQSNSIIRRISAGGTTRGLGDCRAACHPFPFELPLPLFPHSSVRCGELLVLSLQVMSMSLRDGPRSRHGLTATPEPHDYTVCESAKSSVPPSSLCFFCVCL